MNECDIKDLDMAEKHYDDNEENISLSWKELVMFDKSY